MKETLKQFVPPGVRGALRLLQRELRFARIHRTGVRKARREYCRNGAPKRLHFGCGPRRLEGWINVDLLHPSADVHLDLRRPLPWPDNTIDRIYSEHFVEHLSFPGDAEQFLKECLRVLRPGGAFEAGMPDAEKSLLAYARHDAAFFDDERRWHPSWVQTHLDHVNCTFRQGQEHLWAYDFESIRVRLEDAGFTDVRRREWDPQLDSPGWEVSLYVVAAKPKAGAA
jgi:predicted SAM-dependent methyltransferase